MCVRGASGKQQHQYFTLSVLIVVIVLTLLSESLSPVVVVITKTHGLKLSLEGDTSSPSFHEITHETGLAEGGARVLW